jgi:chaperonin GroEL (HSP60 family)
MADNLNINKKIDNKTICYGYYLSKEFCISYAKNNCKKINSFEKISNTALSTKQVRIAKEKFIEISLLTKDLTDINNLKMVSSAGKTLKDSFCLNGLVIEKYTSYDNNIDLKDIKICLLNLNFDDFKIENKELEDIYFNSNKILNEKWKKFEEYLKMDIILIKGQFPYHNISTKKIIFQNLDNEDLLILSKKLDIEIVISLDISNEDLSKNIYIKEVQKIEEILLGTKTFLFIPVKDYLSIIIRGPSDSVIEEAKRSLYDSIKILNNKEEIFVLPGGGIPNNLF